MVNSKKQFLIMCDNVKEKNSKKAFILIARDFFYVHKRRNLSNLATSQRGKSKLKKRILLYFGYWNLMSKYGDFDTSYFGAFFTKILCMMSHTEFVFGHQVPKICPPKKKRKKHTSQRKSLSQKTRGLNFSFSNEFHTQFLDSPSYQILVISLGPGFHFCL